MEVTLYSKNNCSMCRRTKSFLRAQEVEFVEKNVEEDEAFMVEAKATGLSTMPIVVIEGQEPFGGHKPDKLEEIFGEL